MINPFKRCLHLKINKNLILTVVLITIIMAAGSNQIFLKTSAVVLQQQQPLKVTNNTSNATTATTSTNIRPSVQTDFNPNVTSPGMKKNSIFHAGPPMESKRMTGPLRGDIIVTMIFEGLAG